MKGFVPTPPETVDLMVSRLFRNRSPAPDSTILDPGCGTGAFIEGVIRWCSQHRVSLPHIVGVESDPRHVPAAVRKFKGCRSVEIRQEDFLTMRPGRYDFVVGNPPYVPITGLSAEEKARYRARFRTARGRFDLYLLFFEQALNNLKEGARLVFITPEKFLYVETAEPLRRLLADKQVEEIRLVDEETFGALIAYPTITTLTNTRSQRASSFVLRDGRTIEVVLPHNGDSWQPLLNRHDNHAKRLKLRDICVRISCGVATGADLVFVRKTADLGPELMPFAHPTIAGRELNSSRPIPLSRYSMLIPYSTRGRLLEKSVLGPLGLYLSQREDRARLLRRTCAKRKPWYAFHETPRLPEILRPKILCKDITAEPEFWIDRGGRLVPRHSVYYIVPQDSDRIEEVCAYLNSEPARTWLRSHCQRAASGFLRVQSRVLKELPVSPRFAPPRKSGPQGLLFNGQISRQAASGREVLEASR